MNATDGARRSLDPVILQFGPIYPNSHPSMCSKTINKLDCQRNRSSRLAAAPIGHLCSASAPLIHPGPTMIH